MSNKVAKDDTLKKLVSATEDIAAALGKSKARYGFRVKNTEGNPDARVEYLYDAIGMSPAHMDYTNGKFVYGDWEDVWFVKHNYPCMVRADGYEDYKLNKSNHAYKEDGLTTSDVANTAYLGNAMSAIPTVWVKRYTEGDYRYVIFCQSQYDSTYKAYAHTKPNGEVANNIYFPMYKGSMVNGVLRSISGQKPQSGTTAAQEKTAAEANGNKWGLRTWIADELIADLLVLISKSTNCQAKFGEGHSSGGSSAADFLDCGTLDAAGQFFGSNGTSSQVKVFYIEGFWGERWEREEGMVYIDGKYYVKPTPENGGYNFAGTGYNDTGETGVRSEGYMTSMKATEYGSFVTGVGGSSSTFECDYHYQNESGTRVPFRGGSCVHGAACGRYLSVGDAAGAAFWHIGGSPFLINPS